MLVSPCVSTSSLLNLQVVFKIVVYGGDVKQPLYLLDHVQLGSGV